MSRRTLLVAAATTAAAAGLGTGLSGCQAGPAEPDPPADAAIDPLTPLLLGQQALVRSYQAALSAFPDLTTELSDLQAQTTAHTDALFAAAPAAAAQIPASGTSAGAPSGSPSTQPVPLPRPAADAVTAMADLAQAVAAAAGSLRTAALRADGDLAALLGSCAASTTCHAGLLGSSP